MIREHDLVLVPGTVVHLYPETPNLAPHCEVEVGDDAVCGKTTVSVRVEQLVTQERFVSRAVSMIGFPAWTSATVALCKSLLVFERVEAERDLRDAEMAQTRQPERLAVAQARLERVLLAELEVNQAILEMPR